MKLPTPGPQLKEPSSPEGGWDEIISARHSLLDWRLGEIWRYRDLLLLMLRRDIVAQYKQTLLGPAWYFAQPLFTTLMFTVIFDRVAGIPTDGIPPLLFYLAGVTNWNYFAACLNKTATTFRDNQNLFGKVYFPRIIVPLSIVASHLILYAIQLSLFFGFYGYYWFLGADIHPNAVALLFPLLVLLLSGLGLGFGLLITSWTTKYRDLIFLLAFGVQLAMYATPVIYPLSEVPAAYQWLAVLNPLAPIIEAFKFGFLGRGTFQWAYLTYSLGFTVVLLLVGIAVFNKTERNFMDTV